MTFLERILETKRAEVESLRKVPELQMYLKTSSHPLTGQDLAGTRGFQRAVSMAPTLAVVAEVKQASPSKGQIAADFNPVTIAQSYEQAGASAVSVLTDVSYFKGSIEDLKAVRGAVSLPILRKDFIIDELQVAEARLAGADAVLLICAALSKPRLIELASYAHSIGLDSLIEVHHERELEAALEARPSVLGVNNRDLHTFEVSLQTTGRILSQVPKPFVAIAESGIRSADDAMVMARYGAEGILVGEALMRAGTTDEIRSLVLDLKVPKQSGHSNHGSSDAGPVEVPETRNAR